MRKIGRAFGLLALSAAAATAQVSVVHTFPGQNGPNPPDAPVASADMEGGVSPKYLVGFINGGYSVRSKADGKETQPLQTLLQFWDAAFKNAGSELPGRPYDPRILFDPLSSRWFAISDAQVVSSSGKTSLSNHMFIAVSSDDDPVHPWKAVDFQARVIVDCIKLAVDKNGLYTTEMMGGHGEEIKPAIIVIPKADLLWKGSAAPSLAHVNRLEVDDFPRMSDHKMRGIEGMFPALDFNPKKKSSDPAIYVDRYRTEVDGETIIQVRKVTWTSPITATLSEPLDIGLGTHYPVQPTTLGVQPPLPEGLYSPGLAAGEGRIVNAVVRHGSVWAIAATEINNRTGAFWAEIDERTMKLVQHGTLADPEADILFPSLNVDGNGNLGIAMTRTSATQAASTYVTGRLHTDPPNTLRPLVKAVEGRYVYFNAKTDLTKPKQGAPTSDFSLTLIDPSDATLFWSYQLAATNDCMPQETNAGKYGTNWVAFRVEGSAKKSTR